MHKLTTVLFGIVAVLALANSTEAATRKIIGYGWEFLAVNTEDVHRNRAKFAETGLDGAIVPVDGRGADGKWFRGRFLTSSREFRDEQFTDTLWMLREITSSEGLRESLALTMLIPNRRLAWDDDAAWARVANNMRVIGRVAKAGGLKGIAIDHEDYDLQKQFNIRPGDPADIRNLARRRGREVFGAFFSEFPEAKVLGFWMFSQGDSLWRELLNGMLDVLPPNAKFIEGTEDFAYVADAREDAFRNEHWHLARALRDTVVAPENRAAYDRGFEVGYGLYLDSYLGDKTRGYYFEPIDGSFTARLEDNFYSAARYSDELIWVYGERGTWIDWDRKDDSKLQFQPWAKTLPGLSRALRVSAGDGAAIDADIASGALTNLIANSDCDAKTPGKSPFYGWTRLKEEDSQKLYSHDAVEGFSKPGAIKTTGDVMFCFGSGKLQPGEVLYIRAWAKGECPVLGFNWSCGKKKFFYRDRGPFPPTGRVVNGWQEIFGRVVVPKDIDCINCSLSGRGSPSSPVYFDDIGIYRKVR